MGFTGSDERDQALTLNAALRPIELGRVEIRCLDPCWCASLWTTWRLLWIICRAVPADYVYELRRGEEILATGRLLLDDEISLGDELMLAGCPARVEELAWAAGESRLVLSADFVD